MSPDDAPQVIVEHREMRPSLGPPTPMDGPGMWRLACESRTLDVNSRYHYLLWCRDFAATSVVARSVGTGVAGLAGFISGYLRPDAEDTLFVWQVAVADDHRRQGLARRMLDHLVARLAPRGVRHVEATVEPGNLPSARLFESFAEGNGAKLTRDELFSAEMLGGGHEAEILFRIGPLRGRA